MSGDGKTGRRPEIIERLAGAFEAKKDELAALTAGPTVLATCIVPGRTFLGASPERVHVAGPPPGLCGVAVHLTDKLTFPKSEIVLDSSDSTTFALEHYGLADFDLKVDGAALMLLDRSLEAVNTYLTYYKSIERVADHSTWVRPFGVVDLKYFIYLLPPDDRPLIFCHPLYGDRATARLMSEFTGRTTNAFGAQLLPLDPIAKRAMCAIDLYNLSFFSESFITLFALIDDLTQNVVRAGQVKAGISNTQAKKLLEETELDRFVFFLGDMSKKLGWTSLFEDDAELGAEFAKVNTLRNKVMHASTRLDRPQALAAISTLLKLLDRLETNPFGYVFPRIPILKPASPTFALVPESEGPSPDAQNAKGPADP